jgi:hypothetical protein
MSRFLLLIGVSSAFLWSQARAQPAQNPHHTLPSISMDSASVAALNREWAGRLAIALED